jgi:peptidoglycan/LPS O-acetylase OafA/YrhL
MLPYTERMAASAQYSRESSSVAILNSLTSTRFFAAFTVVVFHFGGGALTHLPRAAQLIFERGYVSVSFFFVLSGFILTHNYLESQGFLTYRAFYRARFARIYPMYFIGLLLDAAFVVNHVASTHATTATLVIVLATALVNLLLLQAWAITSVPEWNVPGWSLSTEAFFYLIFPVIGKLALRISRKGTAACLLVVSLLVFWPAVVDLSAFQGKPTEHQLDLLGCSPILRSLEFLTGVFASRLYQLLGAPRRGNMIVLLTTAGILSLIWIAPSWTDQALVLLFALLVFGLAGSTGRLNEWLSFPALVLLGQASYALYILHWPLHRIALALRGALFGKPLDDPHTGGIFFAVYLFGVIAISVMALIKIENPAREYLRRGGRPCPLRRSATSPRALRSDRPGPPKPQANASEPLRPVPPRSDSTPGL